jgi:hypothetical protein
MMWKGVVVVFLRHQPATYLQELSTTTKSSEWLNRDNR